MPVLAFTEKSQHIKHQLPKLICCTQTTRMPNTLLAQQSMTRHIVNAQDPTLIFMQDEANSFAAPWQLERSDST